MEVFEDYDSFKKTYRIRIYNNLLIDLLFDKNTRDYIIEHDDGFFLADIASSPSNKLRNFYFNEETIPIYSKSKSVISRIISCGGDLYPNKIKLFDNEEFFSVISSYNLTEKFVDTITEEIHPSHSWNGPKKVEPESIDILKNLLLKYLRYLQKDFDNHINSISMIMNRIHHEWYEEFLGIILNDLKKFAKENIDFEFDTLFDSSYITYNNNYANFNKIESIINEFYGIDNLYYCPILIKSLVEKSTDRIKNRILISKEQLDWLHSYIFNSQAKEALLKDADSFMFKQLYLLYSKEFINYFLDDEGLSILDNSNKFNKSLSYYVPYDNLTNSNLFAKLLVKNYPKSSDYDSKIKKISKTFEDYKSIFNLLDRNIENKDYSYFYRIFKDLSSTNQLVYLKNNFVRLLGINNNDLFKGMKNKAYELFKNDVDIANWIFSAYDLANMLENKNDYSEEQFEIIFSNPTNISIIFNSGQLQEIYKNLLNLNILNINNIYMSDEFISKLRNANKLDKIFGIAKDIEIDIRKLMLNKESLIDIGEETIENNKNSLIFGNDKYPELKAGSKYFNFLCYTYNLKDKTLLFDILDFYLTNERYLSTFYILRSSLKKEDLKQYFTSRKDLITKIIKENKSNNIKFILGNLSKDELTCEFSKERENILLYCTSKDFHNIFINGPIDGYELSDDVLYSELFVEKFDTYYSNKELNDEYFQDIEKDITFANNDETKAKKIISKLREYCDLKINIEDSLLGFNDNFESYLKVLIMSGLDVYNFDFTRDMIDALLLNKRIKEVSLKYYGQNLEEKKSNVLNDIIRKSRENIVSSITNPLNKKAIPIEYKLDGKIVVIPTIVYDGDPYTFFVRRMHSGKHINTLKHKVGVECYSTITEKNRSVYYGDTGVKFGYVGIKPEDIVHVNSIDAISRSEINNRYKRTSLKYPEWVSMEELNRRTLRNGSYNEIRVKGKYRPEYTLSYDEPNVLTLRYSYNNNTTLVKVLRKAYPKAIENCEDIYSDWK